MRVFISWSKDRSRAAAQALAAWLPNVLQHVKPFVSAGGGISPGENWLDTLRKELKEAAFGVSVVTPENQSERWLNYEAGILSHALESRRVAPYLIELRPAELAPPLATLQAVESSRDGTLQLVKSINEVGPAPLDVPRVERAFDRDWPDLEKALGAIPAPAPAKVPAKRKPEEMLEEILLLVRRIDGQRSQDSKASSLLAALATEPDDRQALEAFLLPRAPGALSRLVAERVRSQLATQTHPTETIAQKIERATSKSGKPTTRSRPES